MSRIARATIVVPTTVDIKINDQVVVIKGNHGELTRTINYAVEIKHTGNLLTLSLRNGYVSNLAHTGTARSLINSMIIGVTEGFTKKLQLIGVGYRAIIKENVIYLTLGFSHPVEYQLPIGIVALCPTQNEIILKGADKQLVGQIATNLRTYRPPEPYKGKGIRYIDEIVRIKEAKKK